MQADIESNESEIETLKLLIKQKEIAMWELRSSKRDHEVAAKWRHQLTREKSEKSANAKVKRLAAKYGLTIHNEGYHDGYFYRFDAWCESPKWIPVEDDIYHENEGCFDGWYEVLTKVQFYADYADQHGISINK